MFGERETMGDKPTRGGTGKGKKIFFGISWAGKVMKVALI